MNIRRIHPTNDSVYGLFHSVAKTYPNLPAVISGSRTYTFRQLDALATLYSQAIMEASEREPRPGKNSGYIGIVMNHGVEMIACILAVLKTGNAYVPAEPTFPKGRIRFMMEQARVDLVVTAPEYTELFKDGTRLLFPDAATVINTEMLSENTVSDSMCVCDAASSPAYVLYTSGTTGNPKGVVVSNANVCHYARAFNAEFEIQPGKDRMLQYSVCSFDIFVEEVFGSLLNGGAIVIPAPEIRESVPRLARFIREEGITIVSGFPYLLLELDKLPTLPPSLRLLISGGDVLRSSYIKRLLSTGIAIYNTYGPSETTVCATYHRCDGTSPLEDGTYPIGHNVKGAEVIVIDSIGRPAAKGEIGEIAILGNGVSMGYLAECPEQKAFTTLADGRRAYLSGDLGYILPSGDLAFVRRKDNQVMILGRRVECEEVDNVLCACPQVERGIVTANYDTQGLAYLTAYFVPASQDFSIHEMKREMADRLASFMMPEYYVEMPSLPINDNGKINRHALPIILKEGKLRS